MLRFLDKNDISYAVTSNNWHTDYFSNRTALLLNYSICICGVEE